MRCREYMCIDMCLASLLSEPSRGLSRCFVAIGNFVRVHRCCCCVVASDARKSE